MTTELSKEIGYDHIIRLLVVATFTVKVMEIADKEGGHNPVYLTFRPLLVSSLLYSAYQSVKVERGAVQ